MDELKNCKLCSWECRVDRLTGEMGVCRIKLPEIATTNISLTTKSITVTFLGCCFRCIYCNAYRISQYPEVGWFYRGHVEPGKLADELLNMVKSSKSADVGVGAVSFTGGEPILNMPYIEEVVHELKRRAGDLGVGFSTNGFAPSHVMERMVDLASFISFEIKAHSEEIHKTLTGAPVEPVLKNAQYLIKNGRDKVRVIRTVVIPGINDIEVENIAKFIADLDPSIPYRLIGFRPNFMLYFHPGPSKQLMKELAEKAKKEGLENVSWSAYYPSEVPRRVIELSKKIDWCEKEQTKLASAYLTLAGCAMQPRNCGRCGLRDSCPAMLWQPWDLQHYLE